MAVCLVVLVGQLSPPPRGGQLEKALVFLMLSENAKQHCHLGAKVEKGESSEDFGATWDGLEKPPGPKSSPEPTF